MAGRTGPPRDRVSEWLDHAAAEGAATMMPEVAFPGMVLGFTIRAGTKKQFTALVILFLNILILGDLWLVVSCHDGQVHWELVASNCQVTPPAPGVGGAVEVRNMDTGEVRHLQP